MLFQHFRWGFDIFDIFDYIDDLDPKWQGIVAGTPFAIFILISHLSNKSLDDHWIRNGTVTRLTTWHEILVGGWTNPSEKYYIVKMISSFSSRGENQNNTWNHRSCRTHRVGAVTRRQSIVSLVLWARHGIANQTVETTTCQGNPKPSFLGVITHILVV